MGRLEEGGAADLMNRLGETGWSGVARLRSGTRIGVIWLCKGQVVHALRYEGKSRLGGIPALESIADWRDGTYLIEPDILPPERSIRVNVETMLERLSDRKTSYQHAESIDEDLNDLEMTLEVLRDRVPGLESLSLSRGQVIEQTTIQDESSQEWLSHQLETYMSNDKAVPETLFVQQGDRELLIIRNGQMAAVLSAQAGTSPEAMFWAAAEARRRMPVYE